ncbi:MAG: hypothetical protein DSZ31_00750 [Gammaproteobacteria bacterium]|nr:MAG: hypothetical protein DSZ31_00750 [Gammaproteobacteria bacterium]
MVKRNLLGLIFSLSVFPLFGFPFNPPCATAGKPYGIYYIESLPKKKLTPQEIETLLYMREEEKLARDVYLTLYQKWGLPVFRNIVRSEQRHMDIMGALIKKYGLEDPVTDKIGVFKNKHLQSLYTKLVAQGEKSVVEALKVGATIEEVDIEDLKRAIAETDNEDLKIAYANLMKGSRNHLRAFTRVLRRWGYQYTPQYLSAEEYEKIISTPMERDFRPQP